MNPSSWITRWGASVPHPGPVLDVACGLGRHTRWFAARGYDVMALDRDLSGVSDLADDPHVELRAAELEDGSPFPVPAASCAGVVVTNYLWRPILDAIVAAVRPGGWLLYETFAVGNEQLGRPTNPDYLLRRNELVELALRHDLVVVAYEDVEVTEPRPSVVARLAATRPV